MDTRRLIGAVFVTMLAVFAFQVAMDWIGEKKGWKKPRPKQTAQTAPVEPGTSTTQPATQPVVPTTQGAGTIAAAAVRAVPATQPATSIIRLGSVERDDPTWRMAIDLDPDGAAIQQVILNEFTKSVESREPYAFQRPLSVMSGATRSMAARSIIIDGTTVNLDLVRWHVDDYNTSSARFSIVLEDDAGPLLRVRKTFELFGRDDPGVGYEIAVRYSLENLAARPIAARLVTNGPITPPREVDSGPDRYFISGYQDQTRIVVAHHMIDELDSNKREIDISKLESFTLKCAGALSVYFVEIARPLDDSAAMFAKTNAVAFNPDAPAFERDGGIVFQTSELTLQSGSTTELPLRVFFGPRQRKLLKEDYYANLGYSEILVLTGGPCAWCTFQWLIDLLVLLLRGFHFIFRDWGLAIIALVVLVRVILHPVTKKSQISMMKMSKLGPEIERLRKKYGDDKDALNKEMMKFYKEQGATPILGCLPMLLQMPIWIALWSALNSTFELRHASFLWGWTWIKDLAKPDHLITFSHPIDIWFLHISGLNLLPILMGVVFYLQMKMQPKPVTMTKEQEQQQKIMMWMMPFLFPLMLYGGPSGLNLYILTSTFIGIIESKVIRDHIKQKEEAEAQQRVIIDAKPTRGSKQARKLEPPEEPKKRGLGAWLASLQERAEQIRREADKRKS